MNNNIERRNAEIESTMLGFEDHGILTCFLTLNYGGSGQGFGGFVLDSWDEEESRRVGIAYGMESIRQILKVVGVEKWEQLRGQRIRVEMDGSRVHRIGHFLEDKWFDPVELAEKMGLQK